MNEQQYETAWNGAMWRQFQEGAVRPAPILTAYAFQGRKAARTRAVVLDALTTTTFESLRVIAARAGVHRDTARYALQYLMDAGDVETIIVPQAAGPRQRHYRKATAQA